MELTQKEMNQRLHYKLRQEDLPIVVPETLKVKRMQREAVFINYC